MNKLKYISTNPKNNSSLINSLVQQIQKNEVAKSYLFYGPGEKYKTALSLAKIMLCQSISKPCKGRCCQDFDKGINANFIVIEKEKDVSNIKISQIRSLIKSISLKASTTRVVMFRGAEYLTEESANALLKTLEEPPQRTTFILTTSNIKGIIPTIISRCQKFYIDAKSSKVEYHDRGNYTSNFLSGGLITRFKICADMYKQKKKINKFLDEIIVVLREEMHKEKDRLRRKKIGREIKLTTSYCLLLKRNVSARLILEDLSLRLNRYNF